MSGALVAQAINESVGTPGFQGIDAILKEYLGLIAEQAGTARVPISRTINGHSLASDVDLTNDDVGAAPAGVGLGEQVYNLKIVENANDVKKSGLYRMENTTLNSGGDSSAVLEVVCFSNNSIFQKRYDFYGVMKERWYTSGEWSEWEYINPPMIADGTEYRTTERHNGKPVYAKNIYIGKSATGSQTIQHNISSKSEIIRYCGTHDSTPMPKGDGSTYDAHVDYVNMSEIGITVKGYSSQDVYIQVWFAR